MRPRIALAALIAVPLSCGPALADVERAIAAHILPGYDSFATATADLAEAAQEDCAPEALRDDWNAAFDAWLGISHIDFGPVAEQGRAVIVAFWPDDRGLTPRALASLIAAEDPIVETPAGTAELSVAARGLHALEFLLFDPQFADAGPYGCTLVRALSRDLADIADTVDAEWHEGFADTLRSAGATGNTTFLAPREARQALFTALTTGLEFTADTRLGRPLGTFERPRPNRAESRRAGRSLRNVRLSLQALRDLARALAVGPIPQTEAAFAKAIAQAEDLDDPVLAGVASPGERLKVEILQQSVRATRNAAANEIGTALGVSSGFNSGDGD